MADNMFVTIPVGGMTCQHCVNSVEKALSGLAGVKQVNVDLDKGQVSITGQNLDVAVLRNAIEELGFDAGDAV